MENKNEQVQQEAQEKTMIMKLKREQPSNIEFFIGIGLQSFWIGIGTTLGATMVNSLEEVIRRKCQQNGRKTRTATSNRRTITSNYERSKES